MRFPPLPGAGFVSVALLTLLASCLVLLPAGAAGALQAGERAPSFSAPALVGAGEVSLADHVGRVVYLDFWASWCPPCLEAMPRIEELREEFSRQDFEVVAVNVDRDPRRAARLLEKYGVGYVSASDPEGRLPERFGIATMPTSFLIDRRGVVRYVHEGFRRGDIPQLRRRIQDLVETGE
jgi:thiol-disulfide isomerase/thioredoxin